MTAPTSFLPKPAGDRRVSRFFTRHPRLSLFALLTPPLAWLLLVYLGSLALLVITAFFQLEAVSQKPVADLTLENVDVAFTTSTFLHTVARSLGVALAVTAACLAIVVPLAFYIAKVAKPWARRGLIVAVLLPLWAGYLVKGYAWRAMLQPTARSSA